VTCRALLRFNCFVNVVVILFGNKLTAHVHVPLAPLWPTRFAYPNSRIASKSDQTFATGVSGMILLLGAAI